MKTVIYTLNISPKQTKIFGQKEDISFNFENSLQAPFSENNNLWRRTKTTIFQRLVIWQRIT